MSRLVPYILLAVIALLTTVRAEHQYGICKLNHCECAANAHPSLTTVNCTSKNQKLDIFDGDLPDSTTDLIISNAEAVMFGANSLSKLKDPRLIRITNTNAIIIRKGAAVNLDGVAMYLEISNCDLLRVEERAFNNIKFPLSVTIKNCEVVSFEGKAFSWLLTMSISNVSMLQLGQGSFTLDPTAANVREHGPGMSIELKNMTISEIPSRTFGSSAAKIVMESVDVNTIRQGAFSANTYNIVMATNCTFQLIESESFSQKSQIDHLSFYGCKIHQLASRALQSAVTEMNITHSRFEFVETGAINNTVVSVIIMNTVFKKFSTRGFELGSINKLQMERNSFDDLTSNAIVAPAATIHKLIFIENEIESIHPDSLQIIGQAEANSEQSVMYKNNYYGDRCSCIFSTLLSKALGTDTRERYEAESYCTVDEFFARCFNVPDLNMMVKKFMDGVCTDKPNIQCETYKTKTDGALVEIKNPRFPHKGDTSSELSERDKKIIGIVIVTCAGCIILALFISFIRWMRRRGYCVNLKNFLISSNSSCGSFWDRLCSCGTAGGLDNARSISQLSVNEYSERHRLNETRIHDVTQETQLHDEVVPTDDKTTQTLPEELTKELLENLKERLDNPENYTEAREMIEHLYELTKMEETYNRNIPTLINVEENIYELPFQNTTPRIGRNNKQMVSVGTRTPSLDRLLPLSPYNRQTALAHEYFEPKDLAVHLYAEIANNDREKKTLLGTIPDVVAEQAVPRGPYLRAVREKMNASVSSSPAAKPLGSPLGSPISISSLKSNASNSSGKMLNRPLPEKPTSLDPGEGTSFRHG